MAHIYFLTLKRISLKTSYSAARSIHLFCMLAITLIGAHTVRASGNNAGPDTLLAYPGVHTALAPNSVRNYTSSWSQSKSYATGFRFADGPAREDANGSDIPDGGEPGIPTVIQPVVNLGNLTNYLFFFANGSSDANWQGATKGFAGDVAVNGIQADERTSGGVPYAGTIYTNDNTLSAWADIVDQNDPSQVNPAQAFGQTNQTSRISGLNSDLNSAFAQINALSPSAGYSSVSSTSLNGLNTQNSTPETFVINITSGLQVSSKINITGDANDIFILRWDSDGNPNNGYQGEVKFQSGGAIVPLGGLKPTNFINVAGAINSSGGGEQSTVPLSSGATIQ
ncbi:MAG: hypothetical protein H6573_13480 [Lewinellaceae bacterium]|nr:hypothetical protein [Phaeodactylibacter sp.]MCB0614258.1 hypothetical protein [Phaeodactylibacter sp.]MCB9348497.1 hypothetical protein [Lewinellaceae bacterium]